MAVCGAIAALASTLPEVQAQVELYAQGEPYQDGSMAINVVATGQVGAPVILAYGVSPLPLLQPVVTGKGPFFIGSLLNLLTIGAIGSNGRLDLPFAMPHYTAPGIPVVVQAFVNGSLSNPATIELDAPYFVEADATVIPNPNPTPVATFGDRVAAGDLNADGVVDLAVGAWFEDYLGIDKAGRVYVLWGPEWDSYTTLQSASPKAYGVFGASVTIADFDKDGTDDLVVGETTGDPPTSEPGYLHVFFGGTTFATAPVFSIPSAGTGIGYTIFGRGVCTGDFNDDGWPDLAVSIVDAVVNGLNKAGRIDVYWGPAFAVRTEVPNPTPVTEDFFGTATMTCDLNGDGIDDLVEGSGRANLPGAADSGRMHVFLGPSLTLSATIDNPLGLKNARFAEGIHAVDLTGDGNAELVAADVKNRLFILWGPAWSTYTLRKKPPTAYQNPFGENAFGYYIGSLDVNGDGIEDLAIADPFSGALTGCSPGAEGTVFVSLGPYYATYRTIYEPQPNCGDGFSWGLITHDVDQDGRIEIVVGSDTAEVGAVVNAGRLSVLKP
jgi:hypothetical protein